MDSKIGLYDVLQAAKIAGEPYSSYGYVHVFVGDDGHTIFSTDAYSLFAINPGRDTSDDERFSIRVEDIHLLPRQPFLSFSSLDEHKANVKVFDIEEVHIADFIFPNSKSKMPDFKGLIDGFAENPISSVRFDGRFLRRAVKVAASYSLNSDVNIEFNGTEKPVKIRPAKGITSDDVLVMVMPKKDLKEG